MKVLIVSQYFAPEIAHIPSQLAASLAAKGHQVRVVTGYPSYPEGRIYPGYRQRWRQRERHGDVDVLRVPLFIDHSNSAFRRILNYTSFAVSSATAGGFAAGADVVYVYATQMTPALGPWLRRLVGRAPYVLHVQDLWPDSVTGSSLVQSALGARLINRLLGSWLSSVYRHASAIVGIAPTMVETLQSRGVEPRRTHLVYNWSPSEPDRPEDRGEASAAGQATTVLYAGNIGDMQDLETAVRAAHETRDAGIRLLLVGNGTAVTSLRALADSLHATNIEFRARVSSEEVLKLYEQADYALVSLKDLPAFRGTIPSKFQMALAAGVPVISTVQGDVRELVEHHEVGFTADAESVESLAAALTRAAETPHPGDLRRNAAAMYAGHFSTAAGVAAIESILAACVQPASMTD